jgi:glycosyltransferase involved in cell wall biosynthesis
MLDKASPISVVIPTYNRAGTLPRALDSVLAQTHTPREIWVIDDGSSDNSKEVVGAYADRGVVYLCLERNSGANVARNRGIAVSSGEFVAFLDSDDEWSTDKLELQLTEMTQAGPACVLVYTTIHIREPGRPIQRFGSARSRRSTNYLCNSNYIGGTSSVMVRRATLAKAGGFDDKLPALQDWDLWLRLEREGKLLLVDKAITTLHFDTSNRISRNSKAKAIGHRHIYRNYVRPFEREHGRSVSEFYLQYGDLLLSMGKKKAARIAFKKSFAADRRSRTGMSILATYLPMSYMQYQTAMSVGSRYLNVLRSDSTTSQK